jgi:enoyl-CoA hydratase
MAMYETLHFELDGEVGILTLNRPEKLNAMSMQMRLDLLDFWRERQNRKGDCRVIIMTGAGNSFCSGMDIGETVSPDDPTGNQDMAETYRMQDLIGEVLLLMRRAPQPIIAAVRGWAAGGGFSFTLACDIRVVDPTAKFIASFVNIGLSGTDMGSSYFLPKQMPLGIVNEYLLTGAVIDAETALRWGLANYVVPADQLMAKARDLADKMVSKSPLGLRLTKEGINQNAASSNLEQALYLENKNQVMCLTSVPIKSPIKKPGK